MTRWQTIKDKFAKAVAAVTNLLVPPLEDHEAGIFDYDIPCTVRSVEWENDAAVVGKGILGTLVVSYNYDDEDEDENEGPDSYERLLITADHQSSLDLASLKPGTRLLVDLRWDFSSEASDRTYLVGARLDPDAPRVQLPPRPAF